MHAAQREREPIGPRPARQQEGARAVGERPAQKVSVEVGAIAVRHEAAALEQAGGKLRGDHERMLVLPQRQRHRGVFEGGHTGGADPLVAAGFHRLQAQFALQHVGEPGQGHVASRAAGSEQPDIPQIHRRAVHAVAYGRRGHGGRRGPAAALFVDAIVARANSVLGQDAVADASRRAVDRADETVDLVVADRTSGQMRAGGHQVDGVACGKWAWMSRKARNPPVPPPKETLMRSWIVVPAPDRDEGWFRREPRLLKQFWIPACAGMTSNLSFPRRREPRTQ